MLSEGIGPRTVLDLWGVVAEVASRDAPVRLLLDKVLEGTAKRVPPEQVAGAIRGYGMRLRAAAAYIRLTEEKRLSGGVEMAREEALLRLGGAMSQGVDQAALGRMLDLAAASPRRAIGLYGLIVASEVLADLLRRGVPPDRARILVETGIQNALSPDEMRDLVRSIDLSAESATEAALRLQEVMRRGVSPSEVVRRAQQEASGPERRQGPSEREGHEKSEKREGEEKSEKTKEERKPERKK